MLPKIRDISGFSGIIRGTEYRNASAVLDIPRGVAPSVRSTAMREHSIPSTTKDTTEEIPYGHCHCGCGEETTRIPAGRNKGIPRRYLPGHHRRPGIHRWRPDSYTRDEETGAIRVPLHSRKYSGLFALIDPDDVEIVSEYRWHPVTGFAGAIYASSTNRLGVTCPKIQMHRLVMGVTDVSVFVDHRDHDGLNNQKSNLRKATARQNQRNRRASGEASRYKGVWLSGGKAWYAEIKGDHKRYRLGPYRSEEDAAKVYDEYARLLHGEFAYLNFPESPPSGLTLSELVARDSEGTP